MRKVLGVVAALAAAVLVAGPAASQEKKGDKCTGAVEAGSWCDKCGKVLEAKDVKDGKCSADQTAVKKIEVCVKRHYVCACGKSCCTDDKPAKGNCKCGKPLKEDASKVPVYYVCSGCGAKSPVKEDIKHDAAKDKDAKNKEVKKTCGHIS